MRAIHRIHHKECSRIAQLLIDMDSKKPRMLLWSFLMFPFSSWVRTRPEKLGQFR